MKRVALIMALMLIMVSMVSAVEIPQKVLDSPLILRQGIDDVQAPVKQYFGSDNFVKKELLDGTKVNIKWGDTRIEQNTVIRLVELWAGDKLETRMTYYLTFFNHDQATLLEKVKIEGDGIGTYDDLESKVFALTMLERMLAD